MALHVYNAYFVTILPFIGYISYEILGENTVSSPELIETVRSYFSSSVTE